MYFSTSSLCLITFIVFLLNILLPLANNIRIAKRTGLQYVVVPWFGYNIFTALAGWRLFLKPLNKILPEASVTSWRRLVRSPWPWNLRHAPFTSLGTDNFLTVAPGGIFFHTADPAVIAQITSRATDFPKATFLYRNVDVYGKNVLSSEGSLWRSHRKLTLPSFSERNNQLVWKEAMEQTQSMVSSWLEPTSSSKTLTKVADDTMRLALHVICKVGLGQKMTWPQQMEGGFGMEDEKPNNGHTMTFTAAIHFLLEKMFYVMLIPKSVLKRAPFKVLRKSYLAYAEWGNYMSEMIEEKKKNTSSDSSTGHIVEQLVKAQIEEKDGGTKGRLALTDSEVRGNLFVFIIAGHETSANSIHFCLMFLALHPKVQKEVQKELKNIFKGRPISDWDYEHDLPLLLNGMLGAVLNEQLRLIAPVIAIPKLVGSKPQNIMIKGKEVTLPKNTMIRFAVPAVHRNPNCWPHGPPKNPDKPTFRFDNSDNDLEEFKPQRWIVKGKPADTASQTSPSDPDNNTLYKPPIGAYIPFSEGQRACLGRRFAQVEILAALAVILTQYSIELAVDHWASDAEVEVMSPEEKKEVWEKAEEKAHWVWQNQMFTVITLQLRGGAHVPMRLVRKGEERFADCS